MNALCIGLAGAGIVAAGLFTAVPAAAQGQTDPVRVEAEALANAASREFGTILERESGSQGASGGSQADLAARPDAGAQGGPWAWYQRSRREFQVLMQMLASGRPLVRGPLEERPIEERPIEERESVTATVAAISGPVPSKPKVEARDGGRADRIAVAAGAGAGPKSEAEFRSQPAFKPEPGPKPQPEPGPKPQPELKPARPQETQSPRSEDPARVAETKPSAHEDEAGKSAASLPSAPGQTSSGAVAQTAPKASNAKTKPRPGPRPRRTRRSARTPGWVVVRRGDTLSAIARRHYGSARFTRRIHAANRRRIRNPHLIYPRQRIYLPRIRRRG